MCTTCRNAPGCTFARPMGAPVLECEEFDGETRPDTAQGRSLTRETGTDVPAGSTPGLCRWCDLQASCTFSRGAGGVWFCEEYQ